MKKWFVWILAVFVITSPIMSFGADSVWYDDLNRTQTSIRVETVPGEILVKFKDHVQINVSKNQGIIEIGNPLIDGLNARYRVRKMEKLFKVTQKRGKKPELFNWYKLTAPDYADIELMVKEYGADPDVECAEPNYLCHTTVNPNDPDFLAGNQWGLTQIHAPNAWDTETGDPNIIIGIIDTGVDWDHPDLGSDIWMNPGEILNGLDDDGNGYIDDIRGWDFVSVAASSVAPGEDPGPPDNDPMDFHGHGTHCSGIASAVTNNGVGIAGTGWQCSIMAVRAGYKNTSGGGSFQHADIGPAIEYAADNGAHVISMSFGGYSVATIIQDAVNYAYSLGVVLVGAAGNGATGAKHYPSSYYRVISISATDNTDTKASFSNYGPDLDVAAPGVSIKSTVFDNTYTTWSGTSMATPFVAGLAGLILSKNPALTNDKVKQIITATTDPVNSSEYIGIGRINAHSAIQVNDIAIAYLDTLLDNAFLAPQTIAITGTAQGDSFRVYYGVGKYPGAWLSIGSGTTPITDDTLTLWDLSSLSSGYYSIRLLAWLNGQISEDRTYLYLDTNMQAGWPVYIGMGDMKGIVTSLMVGRWNYQNYIMAGDCQYWSEGHFWVWGADGTCPSGWPKSNWNMYHWKQWNSPAVGDLDHDGDLEIITGGSGGYFHVFNFDATWFSGWPVYRSGCWWTPSVLQDFDDDGDLEIIAVNTTQDSIYIFHHDGSLLSGWPQQTPNLESCIGSAPAVADLDGVPGLEFVECFYNARVCCWHADGSVYWSINTGETGASDMSSSPAIGDIDHDGDLEIVVPGSQHLYVFNHDGTPYGGSWPYNYGTNVWTSPALADLDGDDDLEIIMNATGLDFNVRAWHHDGTPVAGWPKAIEGENYTMFQYSPSAIVGDIDGDVSPEIVVMSHTNSKVKLYAWHANGTPVTGFPKHLPSSPDGLASNCTPLFCDLDGDGDIEICAGTRGGYVFVWDLPGPYNPNFIEWGMFHHDCWHTGNYDFDILVSVDEQVSPDISPATFLKQNYPNPFSSWTNINYSVAATADLSIKVYDITGRVIRILTNKKHEPGSYSVKWDGQDEQNRTIANGIYFYRLTTDDFRQIKKMIVLK